MKIFMNLNTFLLLHVKFSGLKTFESTEASAKEAQEPETKPLVQEEQKGEIYCFVFVTRQL